MFCPFCRHPDSRVIDSRTSDDGLSIRRRRQCPECGRRFSTIETASRAKSDESGPHQSAEAMGPDGEPQGIWGRFRSARKPLVVAGYMLAGFVRPLMGLAESASQVLAIRLTDRVGKGIRTAPRDALIADAVDPSIRGRAFGFHRAADHAGAVALGRRLKIC